MNSTAPKPKLPAGFGQRPEDFLSLEQRLDAIADILAEITLTSLEMDPHRAQHTDQTV